MSEKDFMFSYTVAIQGGGRIGKLLLWLIAYFRLFPKVYINHGRGVGKSFNDLVKYYAKDTTYGSFRGFIYGTMAARHLQKRAMKVAAGEKTIFMNGVQVIFLLDKSTRNPADFKWSDYGVDIVIDATGKLNNPDHNAKPKSSLRAHLNSSVKAVMLASPFKWGDDKKKKKGEGWPEDVGMFVKGINEKGYDPDKHKIISGSSCTTTCVSAVLKVLLEAFPLEIKSVSMNLVHALTNSNALLDKVPGEGKDDLTRFVASEGNIFETTSGAATATAIVLPELKKIPMDVTCVRVPAKTGSYAKLSCELDVIDAPSVEAIQIIFRNYAKYHPELGLALIGEQNDPEMDVTGTVDVIGSLDSAVVDLSSIKVDKDLKKISIRVYYDNEMGFSARFIELLKLVAEKIEAQEKSMPKEVA